MVYPVQFNPVTKQLKVLRNVDFSVVGAGSVESESDNMIFDNLLIGNVLNYIPNTNTDDIIDLLILTPDEFNNSLIPFKDWKEKTGIRTRVVTRSELESTPPFGYDWIADPEDDGVYQGIDAYIKKAYDSWGSLSPEFILLIGEPDLLPTHYWHSISNGNIPIASDMYYGTMDLSNLPPGADWIFDFPDIFVGRISVDDISELDIIISKVINYESNPYVNETGLYNKILLAATFEAFDPQNGSNSITLECNSPNRDCKYYTHTSENISDYLTLNNFDLTNIYNSNVSNPLYYRSGEPLPEDIQFYGDWDGPSPEQATSDVIQTINDGVFLINHRDHGNSKNKNENFEDGWGSPEFNQDHLSLLNNDFYAPPMFSINCRTAWFDGGTDYPPDGNGINYDCFGELLLSKENGGVVGFIGSTRASLSGYNDELNKGLYDAIWEDFDPFYGSTIQTPTYRLGSILNHGLLFMYNKYILTGGVNYDYTLFPSKGRRSFEQYHILGDPTLEMWTGVPQPLFAYVDFDQNSVTVYDDNDQLISGAKVIFQYDPEETEDYEVKMTDVNGKAYSNLLNNYNVEVSALKHNYIPWFSTKISTNTTWDVAEDVRGNIIVENGATLTFASDITIPKYSRIIVMDGGSLAVDESVNLTFENSYNDILAFGGLDIDQYATVAMSGEGNGVANIGLLNENLTYAFYDVHFTSLNLSGTPQMLTANQCWFTNSEIEIWEANVNITACDFTGSNINVSKPLNGSSFVHITEFCNFSNTSDAIYIDGYLNYIISDCDIHGCDNAIRVFNAGSTMGEKSILSNTVFNNPGTGITIYHSIADILHNQIYDNGFGIKCLDRSEVHIEGDSHVVTQEIKNNTYNEVYASRGSFPHYFHWNLIQDDDNLPGDPLINYKGLEEGLDVLNNCWGSNFDPENDLIPSGSYKWNPIWACENGGGSSEGSAVETLYLGALDKIANGDFTSASTDLKNIVIQYPTTKYAQASLKDLYSMEAFVTNDYANLKSYYNTEPNIINNPDLTKLADFLVNFCEIKLENYPTAIAWFENVIQNPESLEDSIFSIIDLGYTYFIMENGGLKSTYAGNLSEHIPASQDQFSEKRDYLLSLLPEGQKSKSLDESLSLLKSGELLQNIPNPFTGTTQIWYKLENEAVVQLAIYNNTGQLIKIVDEGNKAEGLHHIDFDASGLTNGTYYYSISINGQTTDSKKMTIMK